MEIHGITLFQIQPENLRRLRSTDLRQPFLHLNPAAMEQTNR
uniref:Uncharacterized protein n=1 Tax=Arundo donax TaxID=35708 RepID=A0A0A9ECI2_ARUDO